ncbi:MAG: MerR family DNA-binding transcriptional regulator [Propionibacteriaceae bacterium]|nr:MerR family DNA-binding transcriptional regulator [Propionibacteriaceae bacterium]
MNSSYSQTEATPVASFTVGEAARKLGVSTRTLHRWEARGKIKPFRTPGGQRRFTADEINRVAGGETK